MAANVALSAETLEESKPSRTPKDDHRTKSPSARFESLMSEAESRFHETVANSESNGTSVNTGDSIAEKDQIESSRERFNAALSDDVSFADSLPQGSLTALAERFRVDSLLFQAKQLINNGQLEQARLKAQLAQDLSERFQIDYAPDEDRPIDVVRRIQGQLEATRLEDKSNSGNGMADSPVESSPSDKSDLATKSQTTTPAKDPTSLARIRRDWSTLFRQKKKPGTQDITPASPSLEAEMQPPLTNPLRSDRQVRRTTKSNEPDAIVMANRSVSLGKHESLTSSISFVAETDENGSNVAGKTPSNGLNTLVANQPNVDDIRDNSIGDFADETKSISEADDGSEAATDFDVADMTVPMPKMKSSSIESQTVEVNEFINVDPDFDWTGVYLGLGVCTLLAIGLWHRGTR
jgi:hypothetical protein